MSTTGRTGDRHIPMSSSSFELVAMIWRSIRVSHQGQRPFAPHQKAGHMTAPNGAAHPSLFPVCGRGRPHMTMARGRKAGNLPGTMDAFIAATVLRHEMTLVTRNVADFETLGIRLVNPWRNG